MEIWQIIIPIITTVLGYFFGKWDFDRNRRAGIWDKKIQAARETIDMQYAVIHTVNLITTSISYYLFLEEDKVGGLEAMLNDADESFNELSKLNKEMK